MKVLITGIDGFAGGHLARHLLTQVHTTVIGTTFLPTGHYTHLTQAGVQLYQCDLTIEEAVMQILKETRPRHIYHLAAQSSVPESFQRPWETLSNNIHIQLNLLQGMVNTELDARILVVGSAEIYRPASPHEVPIDEEHPLRPASPYAVSKVAQDMLGLQYHLSKGVDTIRVRPFNHIGPGQRKGFVAPDFASQIACIEAGKQEPVLHVGNLEAKRDFTDVRDMVRVYHLLMHHGESGEAYNIGSGEAHSIQELLDILLTYTDAKIEVRPDPERVRPIEVPILVCGTGKVRETTGWKPTYTFEQTLLDILEDWRRKIRIGEV